MKQQLNRGQLVGEKKLQQIANNYVVSIHAGERIAKRKADIDIKSIILNPLLAYYNTDGSINIALNEYEYLVVKKHKDNTYIIITFKEKSHNNINIFQKRKLAQQGYSRAENKQYQMRWENKQNKII